VKLSVSGKGGVGKTTISALLAATLQARGRKVIAIDADPDSNLLACLGYAAPESVPPLVELKDLIEERTGVKPGTVGGMFRMNPSVDDLPDRYGVEAGGVRVLVAGAVKKGGAGCYCPENALVRTLVSHLLLDDGTDLILDMEAGVEHLSRGTAGAVDSLLIVVEPGRRSIETAVRIQRLAAGLGINRISAVGNKVRSDADQTFLKENIGEIRLAGCIPHDDRIRRAEIARTSVVGASPLVEQAVAQIVDGLAGR